MSAGVVEAGARPSGDVQALKHDGEMNDDQTLLDVRDLQVRFAARPGRRAADRESVLAVDRVSFQVDRGETVGIVGESGSGKTTIARAILRLLDASEGSVTFRDQDWLALSGADLRSARRHLQAVFQDPSTSLDPRMSVLDNVCEPLIVHRVYPTADEIHEAGRAMLREVGISASHESSLPRRLSGGQQQRVAIARALVARPEIVICDEPLSSLDVSVQAQVVALLKRLQGELGVSYLFIGHDLGVVRYLCDRVLVMYAGSIVESASTDDLFSRPMHPYTRLLLSVVPRLPTEQGATPVEVAPRPNTEETEGPVTSAAVTGCTFHPRCPLATEVCRTEVPQSRPVGSSGRLVACHHAPSDPSPVADVEQQHSTKEVQT